MVSYEWVKNTFIELTRKTYPYGTEDELVKDMVHKKIFPLLSKDEYGNYFYEIGDSNTIFTSHLDTVTKEQKFVNHVIEDKFIKTDGNSILGADDKAGITVLLTMIKHDVPGLYYFFIGEEVGCIGSGLASVNKKFKEYKKMISFDRRGESSVITHQSWVRTCSDKFANALCEQFSNQGMKYKIDNTGVYTDSAEFTEVISECTNISVGYYNEHTTTEKQNLEHLTDLCNACIGIKWQDLPSTRNVNVKEYKSYASSNFNNSSYSTRTYGRDDDYEISRKNRNSYKENLDYGYSSDSREDHPKKKKRRGKGGKKYLDKGKGELESFASFEEKEFYSENQNTSNKNKYKHLIYKYFDANLSHKEISILAEQYFDFNNEDDLNSYKALTTFSTF